MLHQVCQFRYPREASRPTSEADRYGKKELKQRVPGLRLIERLVEKASHPDEAKVVRGGAGRPDR